MKFLKNMSFLGGFLVFLPVFILIIFIDVYVETKIPGVRRVVVESGTLPDGVDLRIVQISDIHSHPFLRPGLLEKVISFQPHFIALTGDLISDTDEDYSVAFSWIEELIRIAPVYYIPGNHELSSADRGWSIINGARDRGAVVLRNDSVTLDKSGISVAGIDDWNLGEPDLKKALAGTDGFTVLLSHSPLVADRVKSAEEAGLILSGDTHGGQIRLPFYGPIFLPSRKGARDLSKGLARLPSGVWLYVDSGYGTTEVPVRLFNRSQISLITVRGELNNND